MAAVIERAGALVHQERAVDAVAAIGVTPRMSPLLVGHINLGSGAVESGRAPGAVTVPGAASMASAARATRGVKVQEANAVINNEILTALNTSAQ